MVVAKFRSVLFFKKIVDILSHTITEANFCFSRDGLDIQAMDSSHISLAIVHINKIGFESLKCPRPETFGVVLASLSKILACLAGSDDALTISSAGDTLDFAINTEKRKAEFQMRLIDIDEDTLGIPEIEYPVSIDFASVDFKKLCSDFASLGDTLAIDTTSGNLKFSVANGSECLGSVSYPAISCKAGLVFRYSLRYLCHFAKAASIADQVVINMNEASPLMLEYAFDVGHVQFHIAPKVDDISDE